MGNRLDHTFGFRCTKETKQRIEESADKADLDTSRFLRQKIKTKVLKDGETA